MQINKVRVHQIKLPFSFDFSHSLRKRSSAKNVIVEIIAEQSKIKGYGEGAPRSYVTGESQEGVAESIWRFTQHDNFPWDLNDASQIWDFIDTLSNSKDHNSAICAVETALLDALGKSQSRPVIEYFPHDFYTGTVYYGSAIPLGDKQCTIDFGRMAKKMKISKLKLKMGKNYKQNKENIAAVRQMFGEDYDLKIDVNGVWDLNLASRHVSLINRYKVKVLEQPMMPDDPDLADFAGVMKSSGVTLMADESVCTLKDVERISAQGHYEMVNVRLSKCGGIRNSLKMIDDLRAKGILFQIGCHLGESGILSAAGRLLCLLCGDAVYYEGSYDEFLLKENITRENVSFGSGGKAGPLTGPGLGVEVNRQNLARLSEISESMTRPATLKHGFLLQN